MSTHKYLTWIVHESSNQQ